MRDTAPCRALLANLMFADPVITIGRMFSAAFAGRPPVTSRPGPSTAALKDTTP